jgi:hypothetical protein
MDADTQKAISALQSENEKMKAEIASLKTQLQTFVIPGFGGSGPGGIIVPSEILNDRGGGGGAVSGTKELDVMEAGELVPYIFQAEPV